jgi:EAL domain-containing protein (putative c-di-GMP-specific phosphodiesterase class I)
VVLPASFIPLAEDTGLIVPIGRWVLEEACRQARAWQLQYPSDPPLEVAVNVSARQLQEPGFAAWLTGVLRATGLPPESLKLEITESIGLQDASAMLQGPQAIPQDRLGTLQALREMKALGVKLALDDFGSGASSLASLHRLPIDTLKIDRSLVSKLDTNPETNALVRSIIAVARTLQLGVTAEGIETDEQWARLSAEGCDQGQGSLVGRPQPSEAIDALLAREDAERLKRVA